MPQLDLPAIRTFIGGIAADRGQTFVDTLSAIAFAESGGDTTIVHDNYPATISDPNDPARYDYGLLQINSAHGYDPVQLVNDPTYNVQAGIALYDASLAVGAPGFSPWATFNDGTYAQYLPPPPAPPAPVDPYVGLDGVHAAWGRFQDWIHIDLPRQWDELQNLIAQLGGTATTAPPEPIPITPPPPPPPPDPYSPALLSPADFALEQSLEARFLAIWATGGKIDLGTRAEFTGVPGPVTDALVAVHAVVILGAVGVSGYPPGYQATGTATVWVPGVPTL